MQIAQQTENVQTSTIPYATPVYSNQVVQNQWNPENLNQCPAQTSPVSTPKEGENSKDNKKAVAVKENLKEVGSKVVSAYGAIWVGDSSSYSFRKGLERELERRPPP